MKITSANGLIGCLIYCADDQYRVRIYDRDNSYEFKDYDILHSDMFFKIQDTDVYLYEDGDDMWIDHGPNTLRLTGLDDDKT